MKKTTIIFGLMFLFCISIAAANFGPVGTINQVAEDLNFGDQAKNITVNVYYNGEGSPKLSFSWDVKTTTVQTWDSLTTNGTSSWNTVTTTGSVTWDSLLGDLQTMLQKRKYRCGCGEHIQLEIQHNDNSSVKISRIMIDFDILDINTRQ